MSDLIDRFYMWLAWKLPAGLVTWAFTRVVAYATTGPYSETEVPGLTCVEAGKRWHEAEGGSR